MSVARWKPGRILLAWCGYWLALALVFVGPGLPTFFRVTGPEGKGSVSVGFGDKGFEIAMSQADQVLWSNSVSGIGMILWICVPPILMLFALMWAQQRREANPAAKERV